MLPEVVVPLAGRDGETLQTALGRHLSLFPWVRGTLGAEIPAADRLRETARFMARAHRASLERPGLPQRPGFHRADAEEAWPWPRLAPMLRRDVAGAEHRFRLFDDELRRIRAWFARVPRAAGVLPAALVQGDTNPRNLIFRDGLLVASIDWDECRVDPLHASVAREAFGPGVDPAKFWAEYIAGGGPLDPGSFELTYGFARLDAFIELLWADHDGRANPHSMNLIEESAASIEARRALAPLRRSHVGRPGPGSC